MSYLVYAFTNPWGTNISRRTFSDLQKLIDKRLAPSSFSKRGLRGDFSFQLISGHPRAFFQKYIRNDLYDLIIGLGDYGGNLDRIRIETIATNRYGDHPIYEFSPYKLELSLPVLDLVDPKYFFIGDFMGTYNCNYMTYSIQNHLNLHHLPTRQLFFHLPKRANSSNLSCHLFDLLTANKIF